MKLKELLACLDIVEIEGEVSEDTEILNIHYHSARVDASSVFVAVKGYQTDGHKYIKAAKDNGAILAIVEDFQDLDIPQVKVLNSREALADLAAKFFGYPSKELNVIGITATNGKTTTSFMVDSIFKKFGLKTGLSGTVAVSYEGVYEPSILTTPESRDLQEHVRNMVDRGVSDLIMEVSSHAQEMGRVRNMDYDIVTFNNLSREHIDQHGSFENYARIKSRLIKNAKPEAFAILNFDEEFIRNLKDQTKAKVLSYSFKNDDCDISIKNVDLSTGFAKFDFIINKEIYGIKKDAFRVELGVAGYAGLMNASAAIIVSLVRGIPKETIQEALKNFAGVERRFQVIYDREFKVVDDHYANARNISVTMGTVDHMEYNKFHILYAIRGNRGPNLNRESAEESAKWLKKLGVDKIYSTSSIETVTWKDEVSPEEKQAFDEVMEKNNIEVVHYDRLDDSIYGVLDKINDGDLLLLAGCQGMDPGGRVLLEKLTENLAEEEKEEVLKVLEGRAF